MSMKLQVLLPEKQIHKRVIELANEIRLDYEGKKPLLLCILKGSFVFMSDLIRHLEMSIEIDFIKLSSYSSETESSGIIQLIQDTGTLLKDKDILIIEDIVDTGLTLSYLIKKLQKKKPLSLRICALLDKPSRRKVSVHIDYVGFTVPDKFIVGYGLDFNEEYRHLPDICSIEQPGKYNA
jgi:hypoxanthine phosphoribosyltransferase